VVASRLAGILLGRARCLGACGMLPMYVLMSVAEA
jgi:hypothetical protein